jgi:NRPS condensation-like uncharacterized protein
MAIAAVYRKLSSKRMTGTVTNLGRVTLPEEMESVIDSFELIPPPPNRKVKVSSSLISYKDTMRICFANITQSHELERHILMHLADAGIHVKILNIT